MLFIWRTLALSTSVLIHEVNKLRNTQSVNPMLAPRWHAQSTHTVMFCECIIVDTISLFLTRNCMHHTCCWEVERAFSSADHHNHVKQTGNVTVQINLRFFMVNIHYHVYTQLDCMNEIRNGLYITVCQISTLPTASTWSSVDMIKDIADIVFSRVWHVDQCRCQPSAFWKQNWRFFNRRVLDKNR